MAPSFAEMTVLPTATLLASPSEPAAFEIVAVATVAESHVAVVVTSWVVASLKKAVATNCRLVPLAIDGRGGVTTIDMSVALVTVSVVLPCTAPTVAEMTLVPPATPLANPFESLAFEIVAAAVVADSHVAVVVRSCVVVSLYVPVAVNCCCVPSAMRAGAVGLVVTEIDTSVASVTVSVACCRWSRSPSSSPR